MLLAGVLLDRSFRRLDTTARASRPVRTGTPVPNYGTGVIRLCPFGVLIEEAWDWILQVEGPAEDESLQLAPGTTPVSRKNSLAKHISREGRST